MLTVVWVTPDYFIETDIYIVPELAKFYRIHWIIECGLNKNNIPFYENIQKISNIDIVYVHRPNSHPLSLKFWYFYWTMISNIKFYHPDLIYSAVLGVPYIPFCILRIPRKKIVFAAHNVKTPKGIKHYTLTKLYMEMVWRWFINFQNFSMSQYTLLRSKYKNINNFYAPFVLKDYGTPSNQINKTITFLSYGRIRGYKCIDVLIEAAQRLKDLCDIPFKVVIAGECDDWSRYQSMIRYPDIFDLRIHNVDNRDVPNLFGECHYAILPYQDIAQSGALSVCLNYAKPPILSSLPAFKEYITDGVDGIFIRPADVEDLTEKLLYVLNNHSIIYSRFVENLNKNKSLNFNKTVIIEKYRQYFDSMICRI